MSDSWRNDIPADLMPAVEAMRSDHTALMSSDWDEADAIAWAEKHADIIEWLENHGV